MRGQGTFQNKKKGGVSGQGTFQNKKKQAGEVRRQGTFQNKTKSKRSERTRNFPEPTLEIRNDQKKTTNI